MKKILEHPVISAVIAGLILSFLGWLTGILPTIWAWLKDIGAKIVGFFSIPLEVPLWLLLIISVPFLIWLVKLLSALVSNLSNNSRRSYEYEKPKETITETEEISLTDDEVSVLKLLVQKDGASAEYSDFKYQLRIPRLQAQQILESLSDLGLVEVNDNWMHGPQIYLTREGRDFVLGNKYART